MDSLLKRLFLVISLLFSIAGFAWAGPDPKVMVLDIQLNDLTDLPNAPEELAREAFLSSTFRQRLADKGVAVLPPAESLKTLAAQNSPTYLFDRPAEAAKLAAPSGADYVIIGVALKPTYLFVYPRLLLIDVKQQKVVMPTYAQLESSWTDQNTTARTAEYLAGKIAAKVKALAEQ